MGIRLITLDLDDTLWPCRPVIEAAEAAMYRWLETHAPGVTARHDPASLRAHRQALMREHPHIAHDFTALRLASLRRLLVECGHGAHLAEACTQTFLAARNRVTPYPEVAAVLESLAPRYHLVAVTNGNADVRRTGIGGFFHHALSAAQVGAAKPDPAVFRAALDTAGVGAEAALHVGDDPELDVMAARAVGMATVWVNRTGAPWPEHLPAPDAEVRDLRGVAQWLEEMQF